MSEKQNGIIVDVSYAGYTFVGWAMGRFDAETATGMEKRPYFNMYVLTPVSSFTSEDYTAAGLKAEKLKCIGADVWQNLTPGDKVRLFFDDKKRVVLATNEP